MEKIKYNNKKINYEGKKFDSIMELDYYLYLVNVLRISKSDIELQPVFELQRAFTDSEGKKHRAITYKADFKINNEVIDVKGMEDQKFPIKKKMFLKKYGSNEGLSKYADDPLTLKVLTKAPKWTGVEWIDIYELKKLRTERKKLTKQ